jgi:hypothetical protein
VSTDSAPHRPPPAAILAVPLVVALVLTLFAWPASRLEPRDLPVGVAGPAPAVQALERQLSAREGAFEIHRYRSEAAARDAIEDREVYGAFVVTPRGPKVLIASAASAAVAQLMTAAAQAGAPGAQARPVQVVDVVAAPPRAAALSASVLPLVIAGIMTGAVASLIAVGGGLLRFGLVVTGSVLGGLVATLIVRDWLDVLGGDRIADAGAFSLTILAIGSFVAGLEALLGRPGIMVGALVMVLLGNPFAGVATAPELLPRPVGALGQLMPPGAGGSLLRSTGFFDGAGASDHVLVLCAWVVAGLGALLVRATRRPGTATRTASAPAGG